MFTWTEDKGRGSGGKQSVTQMTRFFMKTRAMHALIFSRLSASPGSGGSEGKRCQVESFKGLNSPLSSFHFFFLSFSRWQYHNRYKDGP